VKIDKLLQATLVIAAAVLAAVSAAPASATPTTNSDSLYFDFLQHHGVSIDQPEMLKTTASEICQGFDGGKTFGEVGGALMQRGASPHEATIQIFGAVDAYCPGNTHALDVMPPPTTRLV
jgi:hypothetical protein